MIGDDPVDYEQAQKLLEQRRAQMQQPAQGPMAQSGGSFSSALDTINKYQQNQAQPARREMPASEAAPQEDNAKTYWAMALSLLGNNGRDLGQIMQGSADAYNKRLTAWEARNSPDAKLDRSMKLAQLEQMDRAPQKEAFGQTVQLAGLNQGDRGQNIQQQQFALTQDQQMFMKQADEIFDKAKQKATFNHADESQAKAQAHSEKLAFYAQHGMDARHVSEMENQREMQRQRIEAENARNDQDNATRLGVADLSATNKKPTLIPGTSFNGPDGQRRYESLLPGQREKADKDVLEGRIVAEHVQQLRDLLKQPYSIANKKTYDGLILSLVGNKSDENATGVLSNPEFIRTVRNLPDYSPNTVLGRISQIKLTDPMTGVEVASGRNPAMETLDALEGSARNMAKIHSRLYGISDDALLAPPPQAQATPRAQPAPQQHAQATPQVPEFDPSKIRGLQPLGPAPQPQQTPAPQQSSVADAQPINMSVQQPQAGVQPRPMQKGGQVVQPMSIQEVRQRIADGWSMM